MNLFKVLLSVFSAALLLTANLRVVYSVSVGGEELPGIYSAAQLDSAEEAARAAAEEISRSTSVAAECKRSAKITLSSPDGDTIELSRALLSSTDGVDSAWSVIVGGSDVGVVSDPSALDEVLDTILAEGAIPEAVTADFTEEITLRRTFVPEGRDYDLMALARSVRGATEVMSVTSDGTVRYG
jgi:hypothetical protein